MKKYSSSELPINTSNAALAFAAYLAGAPFLDDSTPTTNYYDADMLRLWGITTGSIEAGVAKVFAAGRKGHVEYAFKRTEELGQAIGAYKAQQARPGHYFESAKDFVAGEMERLAGGRVTLTEAIAGSVCVMLKRWRAELSEWEQQKDYKAQVKKHIPDDYDAVEQAKVLFLGGSFYRFAALFMEARAEFLKLHLKFPPQIRFRKKGNPRETSKNVTSYPGYAILVTGDVPNNDVRKTLKLPTR